MISGFGPRTIPRLDCLGLIEARSSESTFSYATRFRGLIASASLKPTFFCWMFQSAEGGFRGLIASASLKLEHARVENEPADLRIPRLDCLGLIEAVNKASSTWALRKIPRLDCLGLIEAAPLA